MNSIWRALVLSSVLGLTACPVSAEQAHLCYNYDCAREQDVSINKRDLRHLGGFFRKRRNASNERQSIRLAVAYLYGIAGKQSPIGNDKARNDNEEDLNGRMDCIDHATTTTSFLRLMEKQKWLHHHRVLEPIKRAPFLVNDHWSARIEDKNTSAQFVVDPWFFDHGKPPAIIPLQDWLNGASPHD